MQQIIIQIKDTEKAKMLLELLTALDFVDSVKTNDDTEIKTEANQSEESLDFFTLAGLWQDRDITVDTIRRQAWPRQA